MKLKGLTINFLGDSITEGYGTSGPEAIYHAILKKEAKLKLARNFGIGSTRFASQRGTELKPKNDTTDVWSFSERFADMNDDADAVVVFGGTNDFGHGDAPFGTFNDRTPDTFFGACHYIFSGLVKKYPDKPIVVITPLHRTWPSDKGDDLMHLRDYVNAIREVAEYYSLPVLDLYATSGMQPAIPEIKERYMPDGLHPNDDGHKIIAHKLKVFLENL